MREVRMPFPRVWGERMLLNPATATLLRNKKRKLVNKRRLIIFRCCTRRGEHGEFKKTKVYNIHGSNGRRFSVSPG